MDLCRCETLGVVLWSWCCKVTVCNVSIHYSFYVYRMIRIGCCWRRGSSFPLSLASGRCRVCILPCHFSLLEILVCLLYFCWQLPEREESSAAVCACLCCIINMAKEGASRNDGCVGIILPLYVFAEPSKARYTTNSLSTGTISNSPLPSLDINIVWNIVFVWSVSSPVAINTGCCSPLYAQMWLWGCLSSFSFFLLYGWLLLVAYTQPPNNVGRFLL